MTLKKATGSLNISENSIDLKFQFSKYSIEAMITCMSSTCAYRTEDKQKRTCHFFKIHKYLQQICDQSHLQGLKYYGGPEANCKCKGPSSEQISRVLRFAEYNGERGLREQNRSIKCKKCFTKFKLDDVLDLQVSPSCSLSSTVEIVDFVGSKRGNSSNKLHRR